MNNLHDIIKTGKFETPYNLTLEFLTRSYDTMPDIIPFDMVEYFVQYLKLDVGAEQASETKVKRELRDRLQK